MNWFPIRLDRHGLLIILAATVSTAAADPADAFVSRLGPGDPISGSGYAPAAINYRGKMLYFMNTPILGYTHLYVAKEASPKKFLKISPEAIRIYDADRADRVKPLILGNDLYLCTFFPRRLWSLNDGIRLIKGTPDRKHPDSIEKIRWDAGRFHESPRGSQWMDGDATVFRPMGGNESIYIVRARHSSIVIHRSSGKNLTQVTKSEFPGRTILALSVANIQIADGTGRIAIAWIERAHDTNVRTLKLGLFDGRSRIREVAAPSGIDTSHGYTPVGVQFAAGTVKGGTHGANILQIFLEDGRWVPQLRKHARLLRAEYAIGDGDGTDGEFLALNGTSKTLQVYAGKNHAIGSTSPGSRRIFSFENPRRLSVFTFLQPHEYRSGSTNSSNVGYIVNVGLLGTDSHGRINAIYTKSDRLIPFGLVKSGGKWVEQRGAKPDALETDGDYRSWIFLGTIYGTPPSSRDGGGGAVRISKSESQGSGFTFSNEFSIGGKKGGSSGFGIFEWSMELAYGFDHENESSRTISTSMDRTLEFDSAHPSRGWLLFLKPTLNIENFRRCDYAGGIIPRTQGSTEGFSTLVTVASKWNVIPKAFDMTAREQDLPPYARGIATNRDWVSSRPEGWTAMQRYVGNKNDFEEPEPMSALVGKSSSNLSLEYEGSRKYTHSVSLDLETLMFGGGITSSEKASFTTSYTTKNAYSIDISMDRGRVIDPHALVAKSGRNPFFVPAAYRRQERGGDNAPPPFCIIYSAAAREERSRDSTGTQATALPGARSSAPPTRTATAFQSGLQARGPRVVHVARRAHRTTSRSHVTLAGTLPEDESGVLIRNSGRLLPALRKGERWLRPVRLRPGSNLFCITALDESGTMTPIGRIIVVRSK